MRILTRYILREVVSHAFLGGVAFTFILFSSKLGTILEIWARNSASLTDVLRLILYLLPEVLIVTLPMAVLVGILLGLSRLAADSEITAMRASGMGVVSFVRIVSLVSFVALAAGLWNSLALAPRAADSLLKLENSLKYAQASFEVQPRVFDEDFKNMVLYVQDVRPGSGAALWRHVFLADLTEPASPKVTTADQALVTSAGPGNLHMLMRDGGQHQISSTDPNQYNISTFTSTDLPIQNGTSDDTHFHSDVRMTALSMAELLRKTDFDRNPDPSLSPADRIKAARPYRIELNKRFSYPFACLVLMLVGVPLGLSSQRGGKSTGFVFTILLVFIYYFFSSVGIAFASQGKLPPVVGVWAANFLFAVTGLLLLQQMSRGGVALSIFSGLGVALSRILARFDKDSRRNLDRTPEPERSLQLTQKTSLPAPHPLPAHPRRLRPAPFRLKPRPRPRFLLHHLPHLHLLRAHRRHHPQPHAAGHRRSLPSQPDALHPLSRHAALRARRRVDHFRRPRPHVRVHGHESRRLLALPRHRSSPGLGRRHRRQPLCLR